MVFIMKKRIVKLTESDLEKIVKMVLNEDVTKFELVTKYKGSVESLINSLNDIVSNQDFCGNYKTGIQTANGKIDQLIKQIQSNEKVNSADEALGQLVEQVSKTQKGLIGGIIKKYISGKQFEMSQEMRDGIVNHLTRTYPKNGQRAAQVINSFISESNVPVKKFCQSEEKKQNTNTDTNELIAYVANKGGIKPEYSREVSKKISDWLNSLPAEYKK
jgi:hypothetical protein